MYLRLCTSTDKPDANSVWIQMFGSISIVIITCADKAFHVEDLSQGSHQSDNHRFGSATPLKLLT
ncbi:MAG: hypothetical protein R2825_01495 [Saprospiraceae bacterium]